MIYGAETWAFTNQGMNKLADAETKMERSMLNTTYLDRNTNIWVREKTSQKTEVDFGRARQQNIYEISDGNRASPPENPTKRSDLDRDRRDDGETK